MITDADVKKLEKTLVTKQDLKDELKNYPTKQDLKDELKGYTTKNDLKETTEDILDYVNAVRTELVDKIDVLENKFDAMAHTLEQVLDIVKANAGIRTKVENHEDRIAILESKVYLK
jgi:hypothetical protein